MSAWSLVWAMLAVLHVTQGIWLSGWQAYPGDLGDGRFNNLVLEHGYQSLVGSGDWASPGQFFPVRGTLGLSDTHAGTLPIYAGLRWLSFPREAAWQLWFLVVAALNVGAAFRLFRALGMGEWVRGPLIFAAAGSATMVWCAGNFAQLLPIFPALLAWEQAVRWWGDRRAWRLAAGLGWLAWQFAAGPYSVFFSVVIAGLVGLTRAACGRGQDRNENSEGSMATPRVTPWLGAFAVLLVGTGLTVAAVAVYGPALHAGHSRNISEIVDQAPTPASWFVAAPGSVLRPSGSLDDRGLLGVQAWFAGFLSWGLLLLSVAAAWSRRQTAAGAWALALGLGALATMLFFTKWNSGGSGLWVWLAIKVEPLRAFRASGRVSGLLQFAIVGSAGLLLTYWLGLARSRLLRAGIIMLACLMAVENLGHKQPFTLISVARARTDAVVAAWKRAGDRPVLAFAPGYSNQPDTHVQLDAWSAALARRRVTVNGYSGGMPFSHMTFTLNPTADNARALLKSFHVSESEVSLVESLGADAENKLNFHRQAERSVGVLQDFDLQPGGWTLFAEPETFIVEGRTMYQFTPPAEIRFPLGPSATQMAIDLRMRAGSYDGSGNSDGVGLTWLLRFGDGTERELRKETINPRDHAEDRGTLHREIALPPGEGRVLILRVDSGPAGDPRWDWPLFGSLRVW